MANIFVSIGIILLAFVISALPLYLAVKFLGGKVSIIKAFLITIAGGIIVGTINAIFKNYGSIIAFILLIWIYREVFRLKWLKAILAWVLQMVFVVVIAALLGISLLGIILL